MQGNHCHTNPSDISSKTLGLDFGLVKGLMHSYVVFPVVAIARGMHFSKFGSEAYLSLLQKLMEEVGVVALWVKPPPVMASYVKALIQILANPLWFTSLLGCQGRRWRVTQVGGHCKPLWASRWRSELLALA